MLRGALLALAMLAAAGCDLSRQPPAQDPTLFIGCYGGGPLRLELEPKDLILNGQRFPYRIEFTKSSYVIRSRFLVGNQQGEVVVSRSHSDRFSFFLRDEGGLAVRVIGTGAVGYLLRRQPSC